MAINCLVALAQQRYKKRSVCKYRVQCSMASLCTGSCGSTEKLVDGGGLTGSSIIQHHQTRTITWCQQDGLHFELWSGWIKLFYIYQSTAHSDGCKCRRCTQKIIALFHILGTRCEENWKWLSYSIFTSVQCREPTQARTNSAQHWCSHPRPLSLENTNLRVKRRLLQLHKDQGFRTKGQSPKQANSDSVV